MKKNLLAMTALAAMLFAGCTSSDDLTTRETITKANEAATPINFGTYMGKTGTRGSNISNITTAQILATEGGFGVFAYSTSGTDYVVGNPGFMPNFMYNQQVTGTNASTPVWTYTPVKYWPNEISTTDAGGGATSENNYGKVSFFAYGPYINHTSLPSTGIIGMTANNANDTDPILTYKLDNNAANSVDLLWGTAGANSNATIGGVAQAGKMLSGGKAAVNVDFTKPKFDSDGGKIDFLFKHALAKIGGYAENSLGGVWVALDINDATHTSSAVLEKNAQNHNLTLVTVKEVQIQNGVDGSSNSTLYQQGTFNLATGVWTPSTGKYLTLNYKDTYDATPMYLNTEIAEPTSGLAFDSSTDHQWEVSATAFEGVTPDLKQVYTNDRKPFYIIPTNAAQSIKVRVKYVVRTYDANLYQGYSETEQNITKVITIAAPGFEMNKQYRLNIYLGLTSVRFTASVANWGTNNATDAAAEVVNIVDLPINVANP